jgi:hypothetical protein
MHDPASHSHHAHTRTHAHTHDVALVPSLLRLSVPQRLMIAGAAAAFLWVVVLWALSGASS